VFIKATCGPSSGAIHVKHLEGNVHRFLLVLRYQFTSSLHWIATCTESNVYCL